MTANPPQGWTPPASWIPPQGWTPPPSWIPPQPPRRGLRPGAVIAVAAAAIVASAVAIALAVHPAGQSYRSTCYVDSFAEPHVMITNTSSRPLRVGWVTVALFDASGGRIGSANLVAPAGLVRMPSHTAAASYYVAPGASLRLKGSHHPYDGAANCRVENLGA